MTNHNLTYIGGMDDQLIVTIDYEIAPRADDLGELFAALARDYRDMTKGRVLVVSNIREGSIIATLTDWAIQAAPYVKDAVEIAKGGKALADFGKLLKDMITSAKSAETKKLSPPRKRKKKPGQRSIDAIVKTAAQNGRAVRVKHTRANGETFEVEMSGQAASAIRERELSEVSAPVQDRVHERPTPEALASPDVNRAIGQLYSPTAADLSMTEAQAVIDVVFSVLQAAGMGHILPQIVTDLRGRGLFTLVSALAAKLNSSHRDQEPPLTAS